MTKFKKARVDIYHEKFYRYLMEGHKREEEVDLDVCTKYLYILLTVGVGENPKKSAI